MIKSAYDKLIGVGNTDWFQESRKISTRVRKDRPTLARDIETTEGLLGRDQLPSWFKYPEPLLDLVRDKNIDFGPWQILLGKWLEVRQQGLKQRYPARNLIPFARRMDCDDVASFDVQKPAERPRVVVIHDFASPGWEMRNAFNGFEQWFDAAKGGGEGMGFVVASD